MVVPNDHRHVVLLALRPERLRMIGERVSVNHRTAAIILRIGQVLPRLRTQRGQKIRIAVEPHLAHERFPRGLRVRQRRNRRSRSALDNRLLKQPVRQRRNHQRRNGDSACRLPENRDVIRIAAKRLDIPLDPLQSLDLIQHSVIARPVSGLFTQQRMPKPASTLRR